MTNSRNEVKPTDVAVPIRAVARIPVISADQYSHVGKYAGALVLACFEQIGGLDRMAAWADGNYTDFATKLLPKIIQRSTAVEHSGTLTIDDAITRLERMDTAIEAEFEEVTREYDL